MGGSRGGTHPGYHPGSLATPLGHLTDCHQRQPGRRAQCSERPRCPPSLVADWAGWGGAGGGYLQEGCTYVHIYRQQGVGRGPQHGEEQNKVHLYRLDPALAAGGQGLGPSRGCHARG